MDYHHAALAIPPWGGMSFKDAQAEALKDPTLHTYWCEILARESKRYELHTRQLAKRPGGVQWGGMEPEPWKGITPAQALEAARQLMKAREEFAASDVGMFYREAAKIEPGLGQANGLLAEVLAAYYRGFPDNAAQARDKATELARLLANLGDFASAVAEHAETVRVKAVESGGAPAPGALAGPAG